MNCFEGIKHIDENKNEYWFARELQKILGYKRWSSFAVVIKKAQTACLKSDIQINNHFIIYKNNNNVDYKLSRFACLLIIQNANPQIKEVALAQTYFAVQTRKMELKSVNSKKDLNELSTSIFRNSLVENLLNQKTDYNEQILTEIQNKVDTVLMNTMQQLGTFPNNLTILENK